MTKLLDVSREDDYFVMTVQLGKGHREKWTYEREVSERGLVSYIMIEREDAR